MTKQHIISVRLKAAPGKEGALLTALTALLAPTRAEEGCLLYELLSDVKTPGEFMFYEIWVDKAAHAAHGQTAHMAVWRAVKNDLLVGEVGVNEWEKV